jgi:nitroreductase
VDFNFKDEFLSIMRERHACKIFDTTRRVSDEDRGYILEIGRLSASSFGMEHWKFLVVDNREVKERVQTACWNQPQITTSSFLVVILARKDMRSSNQYVLSRFKARGLEGEALQNYIERYSNFIDVRSDSEILFWSKQQTYIAMANMMNGAMAIGIDSCPIEGFETQKVEDILDFDKDEFQVSVILPFGYRLNPKKEKMRQSIDEITLSI